MLPPCLLCLFQLYHLRNTGEKCSKEIGLLRESTRTSLCTPTPNPKNKQIKPLQNQSEASCGRSMGEHSHPGLGQLSPLAWWQLDAIVSSQPKSYPNPVFSSQSRSPKAQNDGGSIRDHVGGPQAACPPLSHPAQARVRLTGSFSGPGRPDQFPYFPYCGPNLPIKGALLPDCLGSGGFPATGSGCPGGRITECSGIKGPSLPPHPMPHCIPCPTAESLVCTL